VSATLAFYLVPSHSSCAADKLSFNDVDFQLEKRIREIATDDPWTQDQYDNDTEARYDPFDGVYCVYISNFFTDATNLIYYIRGTRNVEMFCSGMAGMQAFDGAVLFAVTHLLLGGITQPIWGQSSLQGEREPTRLTKSKSPVEVDKWRYLFETGRTIWGKSGIDLDKLSQAMEMSDNGDSGKSRESRATEDGIDIDPQEDPDRQLSRLEASESGEGAKKVASLRGGSGREDSVVGIKRPRTIRRKTSSLLDQVSQSPTHTSEEEAIEEPPNKLQRTDSTNTSTTQPSVAHRSRASNSFLGTSSEDPAVIPLSSEPDTIDDLDLQIAERRVKKWSNPNNTVHYGMSDEWQRNIDRASQAALYEPRRLQRIYDAKRHGYISSDRADSQMHGIHGLRFQSTRGFTMTSVDREAAEMLGTALDAGASSVSTNTESTVPSLKMAPSDLGADGWLSTFMHLDQSFDEQEEKEVKEEKDVKDEKES
jgi:hypothetical protein